MKEKFIQFLRENNALIAFCVNLSMFDNISLSQFFHQQEEIWGDNPMYYLENVREWWYDLNLSEEELVQWGELHDKWVFNYCYEPIEVVKPKKSKPDWDAKTTKFIQFLKDNNALIPFCVNLANPKWNADYCTKNPKGTTLFEYITIASNDRLIEGAFQWANTTENHNYWDKLDDEWLDLE